MFDIGNFDIKKFDAILARGLSHGLGERRGQVCIEAAICESLDLPHGADPQCVVESVRVYKITLNDCAWSSPKARAEALRDLGLAQLGSLGVLDGTEFARRIAAKTICVLLPALFRELWPGDEKMQAVALRCEQESARAANYAARAANFAANSTNYAARAAAANFAANSANYAARAADAAADAAARAANFAANSTSYAARAAYFAADSANYAARAAYFAANAGDKYLRLAADLALETLRELNSPGIALLEQK